MTNKKMQPEHLLTVKAIFGKINAIHLTKVGNTLSLPRKHKYANTNETLDDE